MQASNPKTSLYVGTCCTHHTTLPPSTLAGVALIVDDRQWARVRLIACTHVGAKARMRLGQIGARPCEEATHVQCWRLRWCAGGLDDTVNEAVLHAAFIPFGDIKDVNIPLDQTTQKNRGFGFITYMEKGDAAAAMDNMHNSELYGRVSSPLSLAPAMHTPHRR